MYVLIVSMKVRREHVDEFLEAALGDAKGSTETEPGCLRFDLLQDQEDPTRIYFYEVYRDRAAFEAHTQTPHMLRLARYCEGLVRGAVFIAQGVQHLPTRRRLEIARVCQQQ